MKTAVMDFDVVLLHAPSVYDFRDRDDILFAYLSNSDSVHVSPIFEMPPVGILAIKQHLARCGYSVEFFNIASQMLRYPEFDVEQFLKKIRARFIGIDLHWLAHAHGAIELAKVCKSLHPAAKVFMGGISATYYHRELITYPEIDYVARGFDTLLPVELLLKANNDPAALKQVPNLTWKTGGEIQENNLSYVPTAYTASIDWRQVFAGEEKNLTQYNLVIPQAGCEYNCRWCGGGKSFYEKYMGTQGVIQKPAWMLQNELESIVESTTGNHTVTMIDYWHEYPSLLQAASGVFTNDKIRYVHISLRKLPPIEKIKGLKWAAKTVIELSPDSHDPDVAEAIGNKFYRMEQMEKFIDSLLEDVYSFEIYFMIGLPGQTAGNVRDTVGYCEHLLRKYQKYRVTPFICPMLPFLDPGSVYYENPEQVGYTIFYKTLEAHRNALVSMNWKRRLNYETKWLSRDQLVDITYESIQALTLLKNKYRKLPESITANIISRIDNTRELLTEIDIYQEQVAGIEKNILKKNLEQRILQYNRNQFASVRSQQRPFDFGFAKKQWFDTDDVFQRVMER